MRISRWRSHDQREDRGERYAPAQISSDANPLRQLEPDGGLSDEIEISAGGGDPAVAAFEDGDGRGWVAWSQRGLGSSDIWLRRLDTQSRPDGPALRVNTETRGSQTLPALGVDDTCRPVVAWQHEESSDWGVRAQRFRADGLPVGPEQIVETEPWSRAGFGPSLAVVGDGAFHLAWIRESDEEEAVARSFDNEGSPSGPPEELAGLPEALRDYIAVSIGGDGQPIFAWDTSGIDGDSWGVALRRGLR